MALFFVGTIGSSILVHAVPYTPESLPLKVGAFTLFSSIMGVTMAPLVMIAGIERVQVILHGNRDSCVCMVCGVYVHVSPA